MPPIVRHLCWSFDAWIVGSTAKAIIEKQDIYSDWDLIIPVQHWLSATLACTCYSPQPNSFGGWKITLDDDTQIDIWPDTLDNFLLRKQYAAETYALHPKSGISVTAESGA